MGIVRLMYFILNTSFDPHFCALFDKNKVLVDFRSWASVRRDGVEVWDFLGKNEVQSLDLNFLGGVSGPGSFSGLRTAGIILNTLSFVRNLPVRFVRADVVIKAFLGSKNLSVNFLLNSFGESVFFQNEKKELVRISSEEAVEKFKNEDLFCGLLPERKRKLFVGRKNISMDGVEKICLEVLEKTRSQENFIPDYEFPPV